MSRQTLLYNFEFPSFLHLMLHKIPDAYINSIMMRGLLQLISVMCLLFICLVWLMGELT